MAISYEEFKAQKLAQQKPSYEEFKAQKLATTAKPQTQTPEYTEGNTVMGDIAHKAGVAARSALEGVASVPVGIYNTVGLLASPNAPETALSLPTNIPQENDQLRKVAGLLSDVVGLPKATADDSTTQQLAEGLGGLVVPSGLASKLGAEGSVIKKVGDFMGGANPLKTGAAVGAGILAGNAANAATKDSTTLTDKQKNMIGIAANVAGNVGATGLMGIAQGLGRAGSRTIGAVTGNVEPVAGRFLNRAAGDESQLVQGYLESGKVPDIKPILGYHPRSSEIAANAGISGAVRHAENDIMNSTQLTGRNFENDQAIKNFLQRKTAGTQAERDALEASLRSDAAAHSLPFKQRNANVNLDDVKANLMAAIEQNKGNPAITNGLEKLLNDMPKAKTVKTEVPFVNPETGRSGVNTVTSETPVGFKEAYNYKQYIDEMLKGKPSFGDDVKRSIQQSATALGGAKKSLANTLTSVEPEFSPFIKRQAIGISKLDQKKAADKFIKQLSANVETRSNVSGGQVGENIMTANQLGSFLKNEKKIKQLAPYQIEAFERAAKHAGLKNATSYGMAKGSNTAQNLKTDQLVADDIIRSLAGDKQKAGMIGNLLRSGVNIATNSPILKSLSPISSRQQELSAIFAKAELDPKYMAELMKKYNLKDVPINPTVRGALGAGLTGSLTNRTPSL